VKLQQAATVDAVVSARNGLKDPAPAIDNSDGSFHAGLRP